MRRIVLLVTVLILTLGVNQSMPETEAAQTATEKPVAPPATIIADEVDSLRFHSMQLDASGRRARADALIAQAINIEAQASQLFEAVRMKLCKAHSVDPNDYDGQVSDRGLVLVRKEAPPAKP